MSRAVFSAGLFAHGTRGFRLRKSVATVAAGATFAGLAISIAPPAEAAGPDAATAGVDAFARRLATDFLPQMASSSAVSEQLPTLAITPAESVGLKDAFSKAFAAGGRLADFGTQDTLSAAATWVNQNADGDGWDFTATSPDANTLTLGFTRTVTQDAGLDVLDDQGTISLSSGDGIKVTGTLTGSFTFVWDGSLATLRKPSLSIATTGVLPDGKSIDAGLGILGVKVDGTNPATTYALQSTVGTAWSNPDNDGAGALGFDNPATPAPNDGELSADGAATGLVTANRTGSLSGMLVATPRANDRVAGLPQVGATVTLSSLTPGTFDAPTITADVPAAAQPFLTMTPRDLAAGLSQAASAVLGMQNAEDGQLPLMRGSVANAVDAVGGIKQFLADQVPDADPDDKTPGQPKFASLQDMLAALDKAEYDSGWSIDVLTAGADKATYDDTPGAEKVNFTLRATRAGAKDVELNVLGADTSGTASYEDKALTATGVSFPTGAELVGRKVTSGTSVGTVASVPTSKRIVLTDDGWTGGTPVDGSAFAVEAADPKTGAPQLADTLEQTIGVHAANAEVSTATVSPDVVLTLPMALDLSAPETFTKDGKTVKDCDPSSATATCPFQQVDPGTGLGRVITSLPLAADRVLLRQSPRQLLVADVAIDSPVQISTTSGFLALTITGDLTLAKPATGHTQVLTLTGDGDVPMPEFVDQVRQQANGEATDDVFTQDLGGELTGDLTATVDDAPDAFEAGTDGEDSTDLTISASLPDLVDGIDDGEVTVEADDTTRADLLKALNFEPNNPTSLFGGVREAFKSAGADLTTMKGAGLETPIPFVGQSVSQLIGAGASGGDGVTYAQVAATAGSAAGVTPVVEPEPAKTTLTDPATDFDSAFIGRQIVVGSTTTTIVGADGHTLTLVPQITSEPADDTPYLVENELLGAVHALTALTPQTLQETLALAQHSLGNDSTMAFGLVDDGGPKLRLDMVWKRAYEVAQPVQLSFDGGEIAGAEAGGELRVEASGTVKLRLFLPLSVDGMKNPVASTTIDKDFSKIGFGVKLDADSAYVGASIGPVSIDLGTQDDPGDVHAGFGVDIRSGADGDTPSIGDFFTKVPTVGLTNGENDCTDEGTEKTVLCGSFPVYVSGTTPSGDNTLTVTSELGDGDGLAEVFGATQTTVTMPDAIRNLLEGSKFKFGSLAEGLQAYLFYTETAMRTASGDGEMPVIGKDLQAGADFLGDARGKLDKLLEGGDFTTVKGAREFLKKQLATLGIVINGETGIQVDFTCTMPLTAPGAPTATAKNTTSTDTTPYTYEVVSTYTDKRGVVHDSVPSDASAEVASAATIGSAKYNTVTWTKVDVASGYKILRAPKPAAGATAVYTLVGSVDKGTTVTFDDKTATGTSYTAQTTTYSRIPGATCGDDTSIVEIEGVTVQLVLGQGKVTNTGCVDDDKLGKCIGAKLPVDLGIPGLSLKTGDGGYVKGSVGWNLSIKMGMSRTRGFYIDTKNAADGTPEFAVGASLGLSGTANDKVSDLKAQLAIINVDVDKRSSTPEFVGKFTIDIKDDKTDKDDDLTLAEMSRLRVKDVIEVAVRAQVDVNWHLTGAVDAALPGVSTNFRLQWGWGIKSSPNPPTPSNKDDLSIEFNNVTLNAGEFFGKALKPYLQQIVDATKPLQPIIDTIFTPMPVISDLSKAAGGDEITIATLAEKFNTVAGGPKIKPFLEAIKTIRKLLGGVKCDGDDCGVEIGSFALDKTRATTTTVSAGNATQMIDPAKTVEKPGVTDAIASKDASGQLGDPTTKKSKLAGLAKVISFPVLEDPTILFDLISGGDIELVGFDSGPLTLGFQFQKSFGPIYAPPPVMMVVGGGAAVSLRVAAGFDTYGIRKAIETGGAAQVLDSLYFKTVDANGTPIPVVQFTGYLEAGASVSLGVLEVGVVGGIKLTVGFYWNDPNNDGKFRLSEFGQAVANNPICLFNVGGELSLYIKVFVEIGVSPFSVSFDFTLVNLKLLDFNLKPDCAPKPPRLGGTGGTDGSVLYVFAGRLGTEANRGKSWGANNKDETWVVRQVPGYTEDGATVDPAVEIRGLGITESFTDKGGDTIKTVVVDGRGYDGALTVTFTGGSAPKVKDDKTDEDQTIPFSKDTVVFGGNKDDVIRTGEGSSWVDGGGGSDNITTLDRQDLTTAPGSVESHVAGGAGNDTITVGNGKDTVSGDGSLTPTAASPEVSLAPAKPGKVTLSDTVAGSGFTATDLFAANPAGSGNDQIAAGLGQVVLSGNGGNDTVGTASDSPLAESSGIKGTDDEGLYRAHASTLVGGAGSDVLSSGSADDTLWTGGKTDKQSDEDTGSGDAATDTNTVDTGEGSDTVYGSNGVDFVTTHSTPSQKAVVYGGGADDVLTGGRGSDEVYGGPGDDYVIAAPATVGAPGSASDQLGSSRAVTVLPGAGDSRKKLVGGTGSDRIYGSDGPSDIFGDTTKDACPADSAPGETGPDADRADLILGGTGQDVVNAGGGDDWAYTSRGADRVCGNKGDDHLYAGGDDDLVRGGSGADQAYGEDGADRVLGDSGKDAVYGGAGNDRVQGNQDDDWVDGGSEDDVVIGGTSSAGVADGSDTVLGGPGKDVLVGDDATSDDAASSPYPTDLGSSDTTVGAKDYLSAGDDDDRAFGGLGDDTVYAGSGADYVEGNNGADQVWGEAGDDTVAGGSSQAASTGVGRPDQADKLSGGPGKDVLLGDNGNPATRELLDVPANGATPAPGTSGGDTISGGDDDDRVLGQSGDDTIDGDGGADTLEGDAGVDTVHGGDGADLVAGGSRQGASPTTSGSGAGITDSGDQLFGDADADVIVGDNGVPGANETTTLYDVPSAGADPATAAALVGRSGGDTISGGSGSDRIFGQSGDDVITGDADNDTVDGNSGSDDLQGNAGDDVLVGGSQQGPTRSVKGLGIDDRDRRASGDYRGDVVRGGAGQDVVLGDNARVTGTGLASSVEEYDVWYATTSEAPYSSGTDDLYGDGDEDRVLGQGGNDRISGGDADDRISGDSGSDVISGDAGSDDITGGSGLAQLPANLDRVRDGGDTITGDGATAAATDRTDVVLGDNGSITRQTTTDPNRGGVAVRKVLLYDVAVAGGAVVPGTVAGNDTILGQGGNDLVYGQGASDRISGGDGDDVLEGNGDQDFIHGDAGDDDVLGGSSHDVKTVTGPTQQVGEPGKGGFPGTPNKALDGSDQLWGDAGNDAVVGDNARIDRILSGALWAYSSYKGSTETLAAPLLRRSVVGARASEGSGTFGDDEAHGNGGHDEVYGQLGADKLEGNAGDDSVVGDLGEVVTTVKAGPAKTIESQGFIRETITVPGTLKRAATLYPVPTSVTDAGVGGADLIAGGLGNDVLHGGFGNDQEWGNRSFVTDPVSGWIVGAPVKEADPGGTSGKDDDVVFGDHGDDQVWGGWQHDRLYGGYGNDKLDMVTELNGKVTGDKTVDFKGMDFMYGGWGQDAMQADWSMPSPNHGTDKMVDATGAYNGYFVCEAAYGGNSVMRQLSPDMQTFWQTVAEDDGATGAATSKSSGWWELGMVFNNDRGSNANPVYDLNPAHFVCDSQ